LACSACRCEGCYVGFNIKTNLMSRGIFILLLILLVSCNLSKSVEEEDFDKKEVKVTPQVLIAHMNDLLFDCSGLIWFRNSLWMVNDSGGENEVYAVRDDGTISTTLVLEGARNVDWESVTQDDQFVYVGDFGNNNGNREFQRVYRFKKDDIATGEAVVTVNVQTTAFYYGDQEDYSLKQNATEYDCEAMVSAGDNLYLFSKDWVKGQTKVYELSKEPGNYKLMPIDSFQVDGLVTGADLSPGGNYLALLGQRSFGTPFIYLFEFSPEKIFSNRYLLFDLSSIFGAQTEGICFSDDGRIILTTEATGQFVQQAFSFNYTEYLTHF